MTRMMWGWLWLVGACSVYVPEIDAGKGGGGDGQGGENGGEGGEHGGDPGPVDTGAEPDPGDDGATLYVWNDSSYDVDQLYVSPCSSTTWGYDQLSGTLSPGDGFELTGVPPGDFQVRAEVPDGTPGCDGLFRESPGTVISVGRECHAAEGAPRECTVGMMAVCQPFELP